ncbi:MAG: response regulator, partial [Pseudomonadota bacterium]
MALNLKSLHLLVIEDLAPMRELIISVLKVQGFTNVSFAADGKAGFELFCRYNHDIILTNWNAPSHSGTEMVHQIRTSPSSPNKMVPIIIMTGLASRERISQARDVGINEILIKPFSAKDLSKRLLYIIQTPRDFVNTAQFHGPDRRRRAVTDFSGANRRLETAPKEIIKASNLLQSKVGLGDISEQSILSSQNLISNNKINFIPIASNFLAQLRENLNIAYQSTNRGQRLIEDLSDPIIQIKANARIFKYDLMGDLASVMMGFLDNLKILDPDALTIIDAHHTTLNYLLQNEMKGDGGAVGQNLQNELASACKRYPNNRA